MELRKYEAVEAAFGGAWRPSGFRGYKIESLKDALQGWSGGSARTTGSRACR